MSITSAAVFGVFGLVSIAGGVIGFKKAGSRASLIAGGISGLVLLLASGLAVTGASSGVILGGVVSLLLGARFVPAFKKTGKWMPQGMMAGFSLLGLAAAALDFF